MPKKYVNAGEYDRRVLIQRKTVTKSPSGAPIAVWADLSTRWAKVYPFTGTEALVPDQIVADEMTEFHVRYSSVINDLTANDRIVYPVPADESPIEIPNNTVYDIHSVNEIGRREALRIVARRKPADE